MTLRDHLLRLGIEIEIRDDDLLPAHDEGLAALRRIVGTIGITIILAALIGLGLEVW